MASAFILDFRQDKNPEIWMLRLTQHLNAELRTCPTDCAPDAYLRDTLYVATQEQLMFTPLALDVVSLPVPPVDGFTPVSCAVAYAGLQFGTVAIRDQPYPELCTYTIAKTVAENCAWLLFARRQINFVQSRLKVNPAEIQRRWGKLAPQERKIARLLARNHAPDVIAEELGVSKHTVKTQIQRIFDKLGVNNAQQVVLALALLGLPVLDNTGGGGSDLRSILIGM